MDVYGGAVPSMHTGGGNNVMGNLNSNGGQN
jgi:hypothetical protein